MRTLPLLLLALTGVAHAEDPTDLPAMQQAYGWRTVATVVQATTQGDVSLSEAHDSLEGMGMSRLRLPVRGAPGLEALVACGWNDAVVCRLDLPAGSSPPARLVCAAGRQAVPEVELRLVVTTEPTDATAGEAWVEDLLPCWRDGGDGVLATQAAPAPAPALNGLDLDGPAAADARAALAERTDALRACGPGTLEWSTDAEGRASILRVQGDAPARTRAGTACVQDVLGKVRLGGAVAVRAELGEPPE